MRWLDRRRAALLGLIALLVSGCGAGPAAPPAPSPTPTGPPPTTTLMQSLLGGAPPAGVTTTALPAPFATAEALMAGAAITVLPTALPTVAADLPGPEGTASPDPALNLDAEPGYPAPDFTVTALADGKPLKLNDLRGKPVWVNFWASWCAPCLSEMPEMQQIRAAQRQTDLVMLGVDFEEGAATVRRFVGDHKFDWTFALDSHGDAAYIYFIVGLPEHIFVGRDGKISEIYEGTISQTQMEAAVQKILNPP